MKIIIYILSIFIFTTSCSTKIQPSKESNSLSIDKNQEEEYDIIVMDAQYDVYLKSMAKPMNFYSETYYQNKNQNYVLEWNLRHSQPFRFDPDLYAVRIDYDPSIQYGINFEYKLYNFFQFIEWKYKVNLNFNR